MHIMRGLVGLSRSQTFRNCASRHPALHSSVIAYTRPGVHPTDTVGERCGNILMRTKPLRWPKRHTSFPLPEAGPTMNLFTKHNAHRAATLAMTLFAAANVAFACPARAEPSLKRVAVENIVPQQKPVTPGTDEEAARECDQAASDDRRSCLAENKLKYDLEMAEVAEAIESKLMLHGRSTMRLRLRGYACSSGGDEISLTQ